MEYLNLIDIILFIIFCISTALCAENKVSMGYLYTARLMSMSVVITRFMLFSEGLNPYVYVITLVILSLDYVLATSLIFDKGIYSKNKIVRILLFPTKVIHTIFYPNVVIANQIGSIVSQVYKRLLEEPRD